MNEPPKCKTCRGTGDAIRNWPAGSNAPECPDCRGRLILPPARTLVPWTGQFLTPAERAAGGVSPHHVYVTTSERAATAFAAAHNAPCVYVVDPVGPLEADPDYHGPAGISFRCDSARIIERRPVPKSVASRLRSDIAALVAEAEADA